MGLLIIPTLCEFVLKFKCLSLFLMELLKQNQAGEWQNFFFKLNFLYSFV